jgi:hypothetical protein
MSATSQGFGAALKNAAAEILRVTDAKGPITIVANQVDSAGDEIVLSVSKKSDGSLVALDEDTAVTDEDTGYDGDTTTLDFSGEDLNNVPIVPGSVTITPTAGGNTVDATDRDGDGKLYTDDTDEDECGSIDYFTGALVLAYPSGKAPNTTNITADYTYSEKTVKLGQKNYHVGNLVPGSDYESLIIKAAGKENSKVRIEAFQSSVG